MAKMATNKKKTTISGSIASSLNYIDLLGERINLNYDGIQERITTSMGGFISILFLSAIGLYVYLQCYMLGSQSYVNYTVTDHLFQKDELGMQNMGDYKDTFNMFIGTSNQDIDLLDNPYIDISIFEMTEEWKPQKSRDIKMKKCQKEDIQSFMSEAASNYYPNALCFEDKRSVNILNN